MKTMVAAAQSVGVVLLAVLSSCSGSPGSSSRNRYTYEAVSASGTFNVSTQLNGSCSSSDTSTVTLGVGDYCSVTYTKRLGSLDGLLELTGDFSAATGTNSCGTGQCAPARSTKLLTDVGFRDAPGEDPPENASVVLTIGNIDEGPNTCGASLSLPQTFETDAITIGTLMSPEFELTASGTAALGPNSTVQGTSSGSVDYSFRIKLRLKDE